MNRCVCGRTQTPRPAERRSNQHIPLLIGASAHEANRDILFAVATEKRPIKVEDGTMQLVGYFRDVSPGVHFDLEIVRRIAEYGLCIDCDFYNC
jgi:hypothetical protein